MSRKRHKPEQIINLLREAEVGLSQGGTVGEICRSLGISEQNSEPNSEPNYSTARSSTPSRRHRCSSSNGDTTTLMLWPINQIFL